MFRFTIRELLLFTVIAALGVGWWMDHRRLQAGSERARFVLLMLHDAISENGYRVDPGDALIDEQLDQVDRLVIYSHGMKLKRN
jgi:hypothetical protein